MLDGGLNERHHAAQDASSWESRLGSFCLKRYSQFGQDHLVAEILFSRKPGVFVDVGARDGIINSNSYLLETEYRWKGICVEPHPDLFELLRSNRKCGRYRCAVSNASAGTLDFVKFLEEPLGNSGLLETFPDPERLKSIRHEIVKVPVRPLRDILKEGGIGAIDYLDIDVEGAEMGVLQSIDFDAVSIEVIGIECVPTPGDAKTQEIVAFLGERGFQSFGRTGSDLFFSKDPKIMYREMACWT